MRTHVRLITGVVIALGLGGLFIWTMSVSQVNASGINDELAGRLERSASEVLERRWWYRWPGMVPVGEVAKEVGDEYAVELSGLEIGYNWWERTMHLSATARTPTLAWESRGQWWVLDQEGVAISTSNNPVPELPQIKDEVGLSPVVGERVAPRRFVDFLSSVHARVGESIVGIRIGEATTELYVDMSEGYHVRMSTLQNVDEQLASIELARADALKRGVAISNYIDVRLPHKLYYR